MKLSKRFMPICIAILAGGCGAIGNDPLLQTAFGGGVLGSAIGAGTGAIIGNNISDGDVTDSALLGAGIGLAAGTAIGAAYYHYEYEAAIDRNQDQIEANSKHIITTQIEAEELRQRAIAESSRRPLDEASRDQVFDGPTIGQYNR